MLTREIYIEKLDAKLDKWNAYLNKLEKKSKELNGEIQRSFEQKLEDIRSRRDVVLAKLGQIKSAAEGTWTNLREETRDARKKLVDAFSQAHIQIHAIIDSQHN